MLQVIDLQVTIDTSSTANKNAHSSSTNGGHNKDDASTAMMIDTNNQMSSNSRSLLQVQVGEDGMSVGEEIDAHSDYSNINSVSNHSEHGFSILEDFQSSSPLAIFPHPANVRHG